MPHSHLMQSLILKLADNKLNAAHIYCFHVNSVKFAYGAGIAERINIRFAKTHLRGQV